MLWNLLVTFGLAAIPPLESPVGQGYTAIVADEAGRWLCIKRVTGEYVDFDRALLDSLEADHNKLRKKYKG